jgi:hypothetical protein
MDKTKFTLGKFSFPVFFLESTVPTYTDWHNPSLKMSFKILKWGGWGRRGTGQ